MVFMFAIPAAIVGGALWYNQSLKGESLTRFDSPKPAATHPRKTPSKGIAAVEKILDENFTRPNMSGAKNKDTLRAKRERFESFGTGRDFFKESGVRHKSVMLEIDGQSIGGEWAQGENCNPDARILYFHGGAFTVGSARSHRAVTAQLASRTGCAVFAPDYRLMPEHTRMDTIIDARIAYRAILACGPDGPAPVKTLAVGGDSAGANLTLMISAWARDEKLRAANAVFVFSAPTDATASSPSIRENFETDIMLKPLVAPMLKVPPALLRPMLYKATGIKPNDPLVSPVFGDLSNLPPTLMQASRAEMLFDDSVRYARKAQKAGSAVTLQSWEHVPHVWHMFDEHLEETDEAFTEVAKFLSRNMKLKSLR